MLSSKQLQCRQPNKYPLPFDYQLQGHRPSFMNFIFQYLYQSLSERFHLDKSIIDFNFTRLDEAMTIMTIQHDQQYWTEEQQKTKEERHLSFDFSQLALALEIFLQTDG